MRRSLMGGTLPRSVMVVAAAGAATFPSEAAMAAPQRLEATASVALTGCYDDNVFAVPDQKRPDVVSRVTPRLGLAYRSPRLNLRAWYVHEAEDFHRNQELSTWHGRREGNLAGEWSLGPGFDAAGSASYADTHNPGEFSVISGLDLLRLELRRTAAHRISTTASVSRRMGVRTRAVVEHGFTRDEIVGGVTSAIQSVGTRLERQVGPVDTLSVGYGWRRFTATGDEITSHALTATWGREVTPGTHLEFKAGPRLSGGTVRPELGMTLRQRLRRGEAAFTYAQTETTIIGQPRPITAQAASATLTYSLTRTLTLIAGPSVFEARAPGLEATVYGTTEDLVWQVGRHLAVGMSHQFTVQDGVLGGQARGQIVHNAVRLRLVTGSVH